MNQENKINLFKIIKSSPTLSPNPNDKFYISINSNGSVGEETTSPYTDSTALY